MASLEDFLALIDQQTAQAPVRQRPEMDLRQMLLAAGPAMMAAGGQPGASFGGALGQGLMHGQAVAARQMEQDEKRQLLGQQQQMERLKLGASLFEASKKEQKPPTVQEFFDADTGLPYKAQYDATSNSWNKIGGTKKDTETKGILADLPDGKGGTRKALISAVTGQPIAFVGEVDPGKPPTGFQFADPSNPSAGVRPIPGYQEGVAQGEAMKPFTLPEGGARYPGAVPPAATAPGGYAAGVKSFENGTGDPAARNPRSSAMGDGQFIDSTWMEVWPRIAPKVAPILAQRGINVANLQPAEILALRGVPEIAAAATDEYRVMTAPALRQALGRDPTLGESNLAHFLGPGDAPKVLTAPPQTPVEQLIGPDAFQRNREALAGKTAGQLRDEFDRRQGRGQGVANAPGAAQAGTIQPIAVRPPADRFERAYETQEGKNLGEFRQQIATEAVSGRQTLPTLNALETLLTETGTGKTVPITASMKAWAKSLGVNLEAMGVRDNVASAEAATRIARELSLKFIGQTKGAISNAEMQIFLEMVPTIGTTPEANKVLLDAARAVARRQIDIDRAARQYETAPGQRFDRGFVEQLDQIFARHPLLPPGMAAQAAPAPSGPGGAPIRGQSSPTPAPQAAPGAAPAQGGDLPRRPDGGVDRGKLVEGQVYTTPQGKRFRFNGVSFEEAR